MFICWRSIWTSYTINIHHIQESPAVILRSDMRRKAWPAVGLQLGSQDEFSANHTNTMPSRTFTLIRTNYWRWYLIIWQNRFFSFEYQIWPGKEYTRPFFEIYEQLSYLIWLNTCSSLASCKFSIICWVSVSQSDMTAVSCFDIPNRCSSLSNIHTFFSLTISVSFSTILDIAVKLWLFPAII